MSHYVIFWFVGQLVHTDGGNPTLYLHSGWWDSWFTLTGGNPTLYVQAGTVGSHWWGKPHPLYVQAGTVGSHWRGKPHPLSPGLDNTWAQKNVDTIFKKIYIYFNIIIIICSGNKLCLSVYGQKCIFFLFSECGLEIFITFAQWRMMRFFYHCECWIDILL